MCILRHQYLMQKIWRLHHNCFGDEKMIDKVVCEGYGCGYIAASVNLPSARRSAGDFSWGRTPFITARIVAIVVNTLTLSVNRNAVIVITYTTSDTTVSNALCSVEAAIAHAGGRALT